MNNCYTYFEISGIFDPEIISSKLGLVPYKFNKIGDKGKYGNKATIIASWCYGLCDEYDVLVENQMIKTITNLIPKIEILRDIKREYDVSFYLEVVPTACVGEASPCLAPCREVIKFCYETETDIDIDLYLRNKPTILENIIEKLKR